MLPSRKVSQTVKILGNFLAPKNVRRRNRLTHKPLAGVAVHRGYLYLYGMARILVTECQVPHAPHDGITNCLKQTLALVGNGRRCQCTAVRPMQLDCS